MLFCAHLKQNIHIAYARIQFTMQFRSLFKYDYISYYTKQLNLQDCVKTAVSLH